MLSPKVKTHLVPDRVEELAANAVMCGHLKVTLMRNYLPDF